MGIIFYSTGKVLYQLGSSATQSSQTPVLRVSSPHGLHLQFSVNLSERSFPTDFKRVSLFPLLLPIATWQCYPH